jgi:flavin-dependent dehydrogenase
VESRLPFTALGLTRLALDEALLRHAEALGARIERGVAVRAIADGRVETAAGDVAAATLLLASGKHDVRGARRGVDGTIQGLIGFKSHFRLAPAQARALTGFVELILFDGGYAGLQRVEGGLANLCLLIRADRFESVGRTWPALLDALMAEPHLARRLGEAACVFDKPVTIFDVPYGFLHRASPKDSDSLFRLGDQAAVIPSFSGDGMAIALHSGRLAARMIASGAGARAYHARLRADLARQVRLATWLQRATDAWPGPVLAALSVMPQALRLLAAWTRVPEAALRRTGVGAQAA